MGGGGGRKGGMEDTSNQRCHSLERVTHCLREIHHSIDHHRIVNVVLVPGDVVEALVKGGWWVWQLTAQRHC